MFILIQPGHSDSDGDILITDTDMDGDMADIGAATGVIPDTLGDILLTGVQDGDIPDIGEEVTIETTLTAMEEEDLLLTTEAEIMLLTEISLIAETTLTEEAIQQTETILTDQTAILITEEALL